jgi:hypothetical protein
MTLPEKLKAQYLARLAQLITEGTGIAASILEIPSKTRWGAPSIERDWDRRRLAKWRANCLTLLEPFGRQGTRLKEQLDFFAQVGGNKRDLESQDVWCKGFPVHNSLVPWTFGSRKIVPVAFRDGSM